MKKKVGILYDNISGNIGDSAIGISVRKILGDLGVQFEELVPGRFNPRDYQAIVIGGGHLLRPSPDFFYDKFKVPGPHILNSCGISGNPADLEYLNDYIYISVRSQGDKRKIPYLTNEVKVVPCTTMLLNDLTNVGLKICQPSIGINLGPGLIDDPVSLSRYLSKLRFHIYLLPITHYNYDFKHLAKLRQQVKNSTLLPVLKPEEIFTVIGKFDYFISASLHGAIFSYVHGVPFILAELTDKMSFFMEERGIEEYLFKNVNGLKTAFEKLLNNKPDYSVSLNKDFQILKEHKCMIRDILCMKEVTVVDNKSVEPQADLKNLKTALQESNTQIQYLRKQVEDLEDQILRPETELLKRQTHISELETIRNELEAIHNSHGWKLLMCYYKVRDKIFPPNTRRRAYAKRLWKIVK